MPERFKQIEVTTKETSQIFIGKNILDEVPAIVMRTGVIINPDKRKFIFVTDSTINDLHTERLAETFEVFGFQRPRIITVPEGEAAKTLDTSEAIARDLLQHEDGKSAVLVAVGGGAVGDVTGFTAAVYKRGIEYLQVPTTLLAQVDSSIGGKTAVDTEDGKNLLGRTHQPRGIFIDPTVLRTLPEREIRSGLAEIIKYGFMKKTLRDNLEASIEDLMLLEMGFLTDIIQQCVNIKSDIVQQDPLDEGVRRILNFGHTIAHGIEEASYRGGEYLTHGEAVAIGMAVETGIAVKRNILSKEIRDDLVDLLIRAGLPVFVPNDIDLSAAIRFMRNDKKNQGAITIVIPERLGNQSRIITATEQELTEALQAMRAGEKF